LRAAVVGGGDEDLFDGRFAGIASGFHGGAHGGGDLARAFQSQARNRRAGTAEESAERACFDTSANDRRQKRNERQPVRLVERIVGEDAGVTTCVTTAESLIARGGEGGGDAARPRTAGDGGEARNGLRQERARLARANLERRHEQDEL